MAQLSRDQWISLVDRKISEAANKKFPPKSPQPLQTTVTLAWRSFQALQAVRKLKAYEKDLGLAEAEHYAYARVVVCAGGILVFPLVVAASFGYQQLKSLLKDLKLTKLAKLISAGDGYVTPSSVNQLNAALAGANAGLELHYLTFTN